MLFASVEPNNLIECKTSSFVDLWFSFFGLEYITDRWPVGRNKWTDGQTYVHTKFTFTHVNLGWPGSPVAEDRVFTSADDGLEGNDWW